MSSISQSEIVFPDAFATVNEVRAWKATGQLPARLVPRPAKSRAKGRKPRPVILGLRHEPRPVTREQIRHLLTEVQHV